MNVPHDTHYINAITELAERRRIVTHRPIHSENGMKLVDNGVHLTASLRDKLAAHKLLPAIDECLTVEDAVTVDGLADMVGTLLAAAPFDSLIDTPKTRQIIIEAFRKIRLEPTLAFKLSIARDQFPRIFSHSLEVAVCAAIIAQATDAQAVSSVTTAAAAGLFHDLGLLHIDPDMLSPEHILSEQDRKHIYSHPIVTYLILSKLPEWHPKVSSAVLEHHERMDGSGYPRGLSEHEISPLGQLLGVAEITATLIAEKRSISLVKHAQVILRLNQGKLNKHFSDAIMALILRRKSSSEDQPGVDGNYGATLSNLVALAEVIQHWREISTHSGTLPVVDTINRRIMMLERNFAGVGIDLCNWGMIDAELPQADEVLRELEVGTREGRWQLRAIAQEIERNWTKWRPNNQSIQEGIWNWMKLVDSL